MNHAILHPHTPGRQRQSGLSLVELMIAITLGLILTTGLVQFFIGNKQAYSTQIALNGLQESGRYALRQVTDSLRLADHWGGVEGGDVSGSPVASGIGACDSAWIVDPNNGLMGYEGGAASPLPSGCVATSDYLPDTDVFVVRNAGGDFVTSATVKSGSNASALWVRTAVGRRAELFQGSNISSLDSDLYDASDEDAVGLYNYPFQIKAFFIRPCSAKSGAACTANDDGGRPIPTLTSLSLVGNQLTEQALANGVEQMQIEYGIDTNQNDNVEFYTTADQVTANNQWPRVASVRISLVVRSDKRTKTKDTSSYTLPGGYVFTPVGDAQYFRRKVFTSVVQIRNRSRS